ncbi:MAG: hypothetical protein BAJALOKI3v1_50030 [Promethearchaeota archaeon]|nr:MAG: hypothetical protein BAJALOKI3v1_50030 [Candidatus Lokiarchaeota archaeon]
MYITIQNGKELDKTENIMPGCYKATDGHFYRDVSDNRWLSRREYEKIKSNKNSKKQSTAAKCDITDISTFSKMFIHNDYNLNVVDLHKGLLYKVLTVNSGSLEFKKIFQMSNKIINAFELSKVKKVDSIIVQLSSNRVYLTEDINGKQFTYVKELADEAG